MKKSEVYEKITNRIIELLEEAKVNNSKFTWCKPWNSANIGTGLPENYSTKKEYNGSNIFFLSLFAAISGFRTAKYMTFNQISSLGGNVIKGNKSFPVLFFKTYLKDNPKGLRNEEGKIIKEEEELE